MQQEIIQAACASTARVVSQFTHAGSRIMVITNVPLVAPDQWCYSLVFKQGCVEYSERDAASHQTFSVNFFFLSKDFKQNLGNLIEKVNRAFSDLKNGLAVILEKKMD